MTDRTEALKDECNRQAENCGYTATSFTVWLRCLRWLRTLCLIAPVIFGALATWKMLAQSPGLAAVFTLLATVIPPTYKGSRLDESIKDYELMAGEFTNIRDRFRQAALVYSHLPFDEFEAKVEPLFARLEKARNRTLAPPQWSFERARKLHQKGRYRHDYDEERQGLSVKEQA